jgi:hypothetical protein
MQTSLQNRTYALDKPFQMVKMANLLKVHIVKHKLYTPIAGKNYVQVEGWQFAGGMLGLTAVIVEVKLLAPDKWMSESEIIVQKTGKVVSRGFAICSKAEAKKKSFDEYAILSMAQTRSIGKAYRNLIGWIIKLAGYEGVSSEEMTKVDQTQSSPQNTPQTPINANPGAKVKELKSLLKGETDHAKIADLKRRTGIVIGSFNIADRYAGILVATILNSETK